MYIKFCEVWTCAILRYESGQTDRPHSESHRQTDRHADRNTSHPSRGRSKYTLSVASSDSVNTSTLNRYYTYLVESVVGQSRIQNRWNAIETEVIYRTRVDIARIHGAEVDPELHWRFDVFRRALQSSYYYYWFTSKKVSSLSKYRMRPPYRFMLPPKCQDWGDCCYYQIGLLEQLYSKEILDPFLPGHPFLSILALFLTVPI